MKKTKHHRPLALLLCAALLISQSGAAAYAEEMGTGSAGGLCEHHTEHIGCGYTEAQPGHPCEHKHGLDCCTDELICGLDENTTETASVSGAGHTRTQDCYALDCPHARGEHDGDCGCTDAAGGTPCGYVRAACGKPEQGRRPWSGTRISWGTPSPRPAKPRAGLSRPSLIRNSRALSRFS